MVGMQSQNLLLLNPTNGFALFGYISGKGIPSGTIYLKVGKHVGPNRGFGASHIYAEHAKEMRSLGFEGLDQVPQFVATIVRAGSGIYYEAARMKGGTRVSVVRSAVGTAILEYTGTRGNPNYSVVTAYLSMKANGTLVGTVRSSKL